jgi:hypothetical protein
MLVKTDGRRRITRLLLPVTLVVCTRIAGGLFLYAILGLGSSESYWMKAAWGEGQNEVLRMSSGQDRWLYLFLGWDSAWYTSIAAEGYSFQAQSYAFFPGLPLLSWLVNLVLRNPLLSTVLSSAVLGIAWVPVYQLLAEEYLGQSKAVEAALLYSFTPIVYLFSTVAYGEGLFLFSTLGAWYSHRKNRTLPTIILASLASISRPTGILIFLPFLMRMVKARRHHLRSFRSDLACFLAPFSTFFLWLLYCRIVVGDWLAPFNRSGWNDSPSLLMTLKSILLNDTVVGGLPTPTGGLIVLYSVFCTLLLVVPLFSLRAMYRIEEDLAVYSAVYLGGTILFGSLMSALRFVSFLFPFWIVTLGRLTATRHSMVWTLLVCISSYLLAVFLWGSFLNGIFVS